LANVKSAIKRVKTSKNRNLRNSSLKSELRTAIKKTLQSISDRSENAEQLFRDAEKLLDQAVAKNVLHINTASRKKSMLAKALNAMKSSS
jgi:small subunit ribosomal protein S20